MALREQRHADRPSGRSRGRSGLVSWLPELVIAVVLLVAAANAQFDLGHRWFGLTTNLAPGVNDGPARVVAGVDLPVGPVAPAIARPAAGVAVDPAAVRAALAPYVGDPRLGKHLEIRVSDLSTGAVVYRHGTGTVTPASTMKLLTTTAALQTLGPMSRFTTTVVGAGNRIVLVGGGDPFLMISKAAAKRQYPARADLATLAARTAASLRTKGIRTVHLAYDASLFTGPAVNPHWPATYLSEDVVPPITALWANEGRDAHGGYVADPAQAAGDDFAAALRTAGIAVRGAPVPEKAPAADPRLAAVESSPVGEIVQQTLALSDNNAAEVLARHVGAAVDHDPSFVGGTAAVQKVLARLGVHTAGAHQYDGSGLSRDDRLDPLTLLDVLGVVTSSAHPQLREVITGLPVAGFTGSLQYRFDSGPPQARGRVRAKTGTLTGVHALAGLATAPDGSQMLFVMVADRVGGADDFIAQHDLDLMAGALGACGCARAS
ncbi:MAG: dacB [Marmoricola sp.]|nr:dacB [Marmoricola sp.]